MFQQLLSEFGSRFGSSLTSKRNNRREPSRRLAFESLEGRQMMAIVALDDLDVSENTGEKPQSKVWEHADQWWTAMPDGDGTWIHRLDGTSWTPTLQVSSNSNTHADVKADGDLAHILLFDGQDSQLASVEYDSVTNSYVSWNLQPNLVDIGLPSGIETASIDIDSTGRMWVAYDQSNDIEVRYSDGLYTSWSGPINVATDIASDDISVITAMPNNTIGVLWSNQSSDRFGFRVHDDSAAPTVWSAMEIAAPQSAGNNMSDDHVNVAVASDGTLYAAIKTSWGSSPKIGLMVRRPSGVWDPLYSVDSSGTRPIVVINEEANRLIVAYTSSDSGGSIRYKESPMDVIDLGPRRTLISNGSLNNVTSTKQSFTEEVVLMASSGGNARGVLFSFDPVIIINQAPQVNAGVDQTITIGAAAVLDGTASDDGNPNPPGTLASSWTVVSGPGSVTFGDANAIDTTADFSETGTYVLQLTADDGALNTSDQLTITVDPVNVAPVVDAGTDQTVTLGVAAVLDGTASDDGFPSQPGTVAANWTVVSGPGNVTFGDETAVDTTADFSEVGTYLLQLTADDGQLSTSSQVTITVDPVNEAPLVDAGIDQIATLGAAAVLDGTANDDGLPTLPGSLTSSWTVVSGPGSVTFGDENAVDTTADFSEVGTYVLQLAADDGELNTSDQVTIIVDDGSSPVTIAFQDGIYPFESYDGTRDTKLRTNSANTNYGVNDTLELDGSPDEASLLGWDISIIPSGSIITAVSLELDVTNSTNDEYEVYALERAWDELSATWERASSGNPWSTDGADGQGDHGTSVLGQFAPNSSGLYSLDLNAAGLDVIQSWVDDPQVNHGLIFKDYQDASNGAKFSSREDSSATSRPKLVVTYQNVNPGGIGAEPSPIEREAIQLDHDYALVAGDEMFNSGGWNEKWVEGADGSSYFITPDGVIYQWHGSGTINNSTWLTMLSTEYYDDPSLLHQAVDNYLLVNPDQADELLAVKLDGLQDFQTGNEFLNWGGWSEKWIRSSEGTWFFITPNGDLYEWHSGTIDNSTLIETLSSEHYDDLNLLQQAHENYLSLIPVPVVPQLMPEQLVESLGLIDSTNYSFDWGGWQEKWIFGAGAWYFITPVGDFYRWDGGTIDNSDRLGSLGTQFYDTPQLIFVDAAAAAAVDAEIIALDQNLGLVTSNNYSLNWGGWNEKWIQAEDSSWYFLTSDGNFYQWHGGTIDNNTLLTTIDPVFYDLPVLLTTAYA